jgi:hypothetical protein
MDIVQKDKNIVILPRNTISGRILKRIVAGSALLLCLSWIHPVHVSVSNMDVYPGEGRLELAIRIFADDFQDLIFQQYGVQLNLTGAEDPGRQAGVIDLYIDQAFRVEVNGGDEIMLKHQKTEFNEGAVWLYYEGNCGCVIREVRIRDMVMLDKFDDQTNLVIVSCNGRQSGYRLDNKTKEFEFTVDK